MADPIPVITPCDHAEILSYIDALHADLHHVVAVLDAQGRDVSALRTALDTYLPALAALTGNGQGVSVMGARRARRLINALPQDS
jgi:hypothetical protein